MFAPTLSRQIATALDDLPVDLHQWELRNAAATEDLQPESSVENLPPELQAMLQEPPGADLSPETAPPGVLTAGAPAQARAPRGTPIGGQWIDTPSSVLHELGWAGEEPDAPEQAYTVPETNPPATWDPWMYQSGMDSHMPTAEDYTPEQVAAIGDYTGQQNVPMNTWLRDGKLNPAYPGSTPERVQSDIAAFDSTFTPIPGDTPVYRGLGNRLKTDDLDALVGSVIADKGYLSTSLNPVATTPFGGGIGSTVPIIRIVVPKGTPVVWPGKMATVSGEMEVVLPHGSPLAVVGWHYDDKMGRNIVDAVVANPSSITAAAPSQARAPRGTPIGGEWIETPGALLSGIGARDRLMLGYVNDRELSDARGRALAKADALPEPTDADRAAAAARHGKSKRQGGDDRPGSVRRRKLRQDLLTEFGDGTTCPCLNCGRRLDITTVSMDRIIPGSDNGRYVPKNLIPMDYDCNRVRSNSDFDDMSATWMISASARPMAVHAPTFRDPSTAACTTTGCDAPADSTLAPSGPREVLAQLRGATSPTLDRTGSASSTSTESSATAPPTSLDRTNAAAPAIPPGLGLTPVTPPFTSDSARFEGQHGTSPAPVAAPQPGTGPTTTPTRTSAPVTMAPTAPTSDTTSPGASPATSDTTSIDSTNPSLPIGTMVRARVSGWGRDESGDLGGADDAPSLEGVPEWVEGPLEGQAVPGYFKHIVGGYDVDPEGMEQMP